MTHERKRVKNAEIVVDNLLNWCQIRGDRYRTAMIILFCQKVVVICELLRFKKLYWGIYTV